MMLQQQKLKLIRHLPKQQKFFLKLGETGNLLGELTGNMNSTQDDIKTTIIYQTYEVSAGRLKQYEREKEYQPGKKADPFDEPVTGDEGSNSSSGTSNGSSNENTENSGDGTLFGTKNQK